MGYLDFLPYWLIAHLVAPLLTAVIAPVSFADRARLFGKASLLSLGFAIGGYLAAAASVRTGFHPGIAIAMYGMPLALWIATGFMVRARSPAWRDWPASRLTRLELLLYAMLLVYTIVALMLMPLPALSLKNYFEGHGLSVPAVVRYLFPLACLLALDLMPTIPMAGLVIGTVFYALQVIGLSGNEGSWTLGTGLWTTRLYFAHGARTLTVDLLPLLMLALHVAAIVLRRRRRDLF